VGEKSRALWAYTLHGMTWSEQNRYMTIVESAVRCDTCQDWIRTGDWPFCGGDPAKHRTD
jgi:hypothetical protein